MTARDQWRQHVAQALTDWRLFAIGPRPNINYEQEMIRSAIAEILSLRLQVAYAPIFGTLQKIEGKIGVLADLRAEPWAPATHKVNRR